MLRSGEIKIKILGIIIVSAESSVLFFIFILKLWFAGPIAIVAEVFIVLSEGTDRVSLCVDISAVASGAQAIAAVAIAAIAIRAVCIDVCEAVGIDLSFRVDLDRIDRAGNDECSC